MEYDLRQAIRNYARLHMMTSDIKLTPAMATAEAVAQAQVAGISPASVPITVAGSHDPREEKARPRFTLFLALVAQLALLLLIFRLYRIEDGKFLLMSSLIVGIFSIHYWLPFRIKESFWVLASMTGAFLLLEPWVATLLIGVGLTFFLILRCPIPFRWRILLVTGVFVGLVWSFVTSKLPIPTGFYPVFGAVFMFRIITYLYDLAHSEEPARLMPFLSYFFLLPNFYFTLFPVIDFQTMRKTYYQRDIHEVAQRGIQWMVRGTIQLLLYRLVIYLNDPYLPDRVTSFGALARTLLLTFLLYLNVSGTFHLIVGMLHLFGYDLPETNRRYLLASSFTDFWRRINIYWKDFMVKTVYFPVYFKFRKRSEIGAQLTATAAVFFVTWGLHSYQFFWIKGQYMVSWPDTIFWGSLALLVMANVLWESKRKGRRVDSSWRARGIRSLQVLGTLAVITVLWSLWSSPSLGAWTYLMTHWMHSAS